jgi:NADH-quinone oxidoreductase subunit G
MGIHPAFGPGYTPLETSGLNARAIYEGAANGSLKALFVLGADPVGDGLMAGRGRLDFLVVQELFLTETAALADVVLPAQSWAEREGTYTNGERRVQRYYQAIAPVGDNRADWQILAQIGERVGLGKPAFAASLVFNDIAKAVPQYKGMDYRTLAKVEKQWPDVGGEDAYYGGNAYDNKAGLGQQWQALAELDAVGSFDVPETAVQRVDGTVLMRTTALYTPGTLINLSDVLASRLAKPKAVVSETDASTYQLATGDLVNLTIQGTAVSAQAVIDGNLSPGLVLLSGVPYFPGSVAVQISKLEKEEEFA